MQDKKASFVFHAEYIEDLPEAHRREWQDYIVAYGLYGTEPPIEKDTLAYSLWIKIAGQIDYERDKYDGKCARGRAAANARWHGSDAQGDTPNAEKTAAARFVKPTVDEVRAYAAQKGYAVDADKFVNYYESNGWRVGRSPMKNWKAAVANWAHNSYGAGKQAEKPAYKVCPNCGKELIYWNGTAKKYICSLCGYEAAKL